MLQNTKTKIQAEIKKETPFLKNMLIFFTIAYLLLSLNPPASSLNQPSSRVAQASEFIQSAEIEPLKTPLSVPAFDVKKPDTGAPLSNPPTAVKTALTLDRAKKLNGWIKSKDPNSPLNNANFDTGQILLDIEKDTGVKAEFILAKAFQETKLGTSGVCRRNVGSVGETDSDRRTGKFCQDFRSDNQPKIMDRMEHYQTDDYLFKSLRAIANTMNNQYLGGSTVLCQLSSGYNGCNEQQVKAMKGKWYASNSSHSQALVVILKDITGQEWSLQSNFKN
jgi:hypothetical protein